MSVKVIPAFNGKGNCLVSLNFIKAGRAFHKISEYEIIASPTRTSIQINMHEHIEEFSRLAYFNNCDPSDGIACNHTGFIRTDFFLSQH